MNKDLEVKYEPLQDAQDEEISSQLRFSQTHSPKYVPGTPSFAFSEPYVTPFQNFNNSTFHGDDDGIVAHKGTMWRHSRRSRVILCCLGMGVITLLSLLIVTGIGMGLDYQCNHPAHQKTRIFNSPFRSVNNLVINGVNAFVEFETEDDDDQVTDIVVTVSTGARREEDFKLMTVSSTKGNGDFIINVGGDSNLDLDSFMERCLLTTVKVVFPPKRIYKGNINVNIKSGEIELEKMNGWKTANFSVVRGKIEVEDSTATDVVMSVYKGKISTKNFKANRMDITVNNVQTKMSKLTIDNLNIKINGESEVSAKEITLSSSKSNITVGGEGSGSSLKLSGLNQGSTNIKLPNGKVSVGVLSSFCGPFELNAGDFEFNGNGISVDPSSSSLKKTGTIGKCTQPTSSLISQSKGKVKLTVKD